MNGPNAVCVLVLILSPTLARAQASTQTSTPTTAVPSSEPPPGNADTTSTAARVATLSRVVRFPDTTPVVGAAIKLVTVDSPRVVRRRTTTDGDGRFQLDTVPYGTYDLEIAYPLAKPATRRLVVSGEVDGEIIVREPAPQEPARSTQFGYTVAALTLYLIILIFARWHHISRSLHAMIMRQLQATRMRLLTEVGAGDAPGLDSLKESVEQLIEEERRREEAYSGWNFFSNFFHKLPEFFFWSRGNENATWVAIHEIERQLAAFLAPPAQVDVHLRWAAAELRIIGKPVALVIASAIETSLAVPTPGNTYERLVLLETRKALLGRATAIIYGERDTSFSTLMEWQNKASWLTLAAIILIVLLVLALGHAVLFLAGAAGGYLSRLMRALKRDDVPLDYGASWSTLFLSPLFGALAGWFGIAVITLATDPSVQLLGSAFRLVDWNRATEVPTLAVAFLFGFSERLFDAVVSAVDQHAVDGKAAQATAVPAHVTVPTVVPPRTDAAAPGGARVTASMPTAGSATTPASVAPLHPAMPTLLDTPPGPAPS